MTQSTAPNAARGKEIVTGCGAILRWPVSGLSVQQVFLADLSERLEVVAPRGRYLGRVGVGLEGLHRVVVLEHLGHVLKLVGVLEEALQVPADGHAGRHRRAGEAAAVGDVNADPLAFLAGGLARLGRKG